MQTNQNAKRLALLAEPRKIKLMVMTALMIASSSLFLLAKTNDSVPYPKGYRQWTHIKKEMNMPQDPARKGKVVIYHIYANEKAVEGYRNKRFADGSVVVTDFYETKENNGMFEETTRLRVAVMVKDSQRYAKTDGWGFEQFKGDSETERMLDEKGVASCYGCHSKQKEQDFIYSTFHQ